MAKDEEGGPEAGLVLGKAEGALLTNASAGRQRPQMAWHWGAWHKQTKFPGLRGTGREEGYRGSLQGEGHHRGVPCAA